MSDKNSSDTEKVSLMSAAGFFGEKPVSALKTARDVVVGAAGAAVLTVAFHATGLGDKISDFSNIDDQPSAEQTLDHSEFDGP